VLTLESVEPDGDVAQRAVMVSCDLILIRESTQDCVKKTVPDAGIHQDDRANCAGNVYPDQQLTFVQIDAI